MMGQGRAVLENGEEGETKAGGVIRLLSGSVITVAYFIFILLFFLFFDNHPQFQVGRRQEIYLQKKKRTIPSFLFIADARHLQRMTARMGASATSTLQISETGSRSGYIFPNWG